LNRDFAPSIRRCPRKLNGSAAATGRRMRGERNAAHAKSAVTDYFFTLAFGGERTKSVGQRAGKIGSLSAVHLPERLRKGDQGNIRPLGGIENKEVKSQFLLLARQTILSKDGRTLASKFATPQSLVDFCKNSPDAVKTDGDCDLDEIRRPGVKEGLQIDVVRQVGPDANNFTSLFSVRVVKRD
jgi:hypothetical protein